MKVGARIGGRRLILPTVAVAGYLVLAGVVAESHIDLNRAQSQARGLATELRTVAADLEGTRLNLETAVSEVNSAKAQLTAEKQRSQRLQQEVNRLKETIDCLQSRLLPQLVC